MAFQKGDKVVVKPDSLDSAGYGNAYLARDRKLVGTITEVLDDSRGAVAVNFPDLDWTGKFLNKTLELAPAPAPANKYADAIKGFHIFSGAWYVGKDAVYAPGISDSVSFGLYHADGSTYGEAHLRWLATDEAGDVPQLEIRLDDWNVLIHMPEVMTDLVSADPRLTPQAFCDLLSARGFSDRTERVNPNLKRRYRITTRYAEDGKPDCVKDFEGVPEWAKMYEPMLTAPNFVKITVSFETTQTIIELAE